MALADVYDALINKRIYKAAMSHSAAIEIIREGRAKHFDPQIVDCFLEDVDEFRYIASRFSDDDAESSSELPPEFRLPRVT
jgi:putative two-component system response regulator